MMMMLNFLVFLEIPKFSFHLLKLRSSSVLHSQHIYEFIVQPDLPKKNTTSQGQEDRCGRQREVRAESSSIR